MWPSCHRCRHGQPIIGVVEMGEDGGTQSTHRVHLRREISDTRLTQFTKAIIRQGIRMKLRKYLLSGLAQ